MSAAKNKILKWFFFRDLGHLLPRDPGQTTPCDSPSDRWRLLCWVILLMVSFGLFQHKLTNLVIFMSCIAVLFLIINSSTLDPSTTIFSANLGVPIIALGFASVLIIALENPTYHNHKFLVQKFLLRECHLFRHWCPDTYVMAVSVTFLTCIVRGLHKRLALEFRK